MATVKGTNITKYDAGGSGDNCIADGYIKTVEKVWLDTYVVASAITSTTSIKIGRVPANKKVTDIVVHFPVLTAAATHSTIYCGTGSTTATDRYFGTLTSNGSNELATLSLATIGTGRLCHSGALTPLPTDVDVYITVSPGITITAGTIKSIIRYT